MWNNEYTYKKGYNGTLQERMESKTSKAGENDCWLWTASCDTAGYGIIRIDNKLRHASHIAFEIYNNKPVPHDMLIMHSCDNPLCVNPKHLSIGTKLLNNVDKKKKGRCNPRRGNEHPMSKLNTNTVKEIRCLFKQGHHTFTSLASLFNINRTTVSRIINNKLWT